MPCESAGAGLVTLGAIRYRLMLAEASDALTHYERLERLAARPNSQAYVQQAPSAARPIRGRFRLDGTDVRGFVWARRDQSVGGDRFTQDGPLRISIHPWNANEWRLDHEAPAVAILGAELPYGCIYQALVDGAEMLDSNLRQSDSAVCLAGRVSGESVSRAAFSSIRFECGNEVADLALLLTVHRWSIGTVSRVAFFNSRTRQLDRNTGFIGLVVADGDLAFLRVIDAPEFRHSDVVGVIDRVVDRDRLETIGNKLAELSQQWYAPEDLPVHQDVAPPSGISVSVIRRRQG